MSNYGGFVRNVTCTRVNTATTTTVPSGSQSVAVTVIAGTAGTSPTVQGAATPVGSFSFNAQDAETLSVVTVVTSAGDDVLISVIR
jgi:hypothetical protein